MKCFFLSTLVTVFLVYCVVIATARPAYGYVDPGSGFLAVQTLASVAAGIGYFLRKRIRSLFGGKKEDEAAAELQDLGEGESRGSK